ncbi:hypothetical protein V5O48_012453 [Marasmius crinis-equi]|uniref:Uncharacterized protein n=1 Tax=Marasmius crinis-equi TaxID=585013 RepID=A0ABR3F2Q5_9AGAR
MDNPELLQLVLRRFEYCLTSPTPPPIAGPSGVPHSSNTNSRSSQEVPIEDATGSVGEAEPEQNAEPTRVETEQQTVEQEQREMINQGTQAPERTVTLGITHVPGGAQRNEGEDLSNFPRGEDPEDELEYTDGSEHSPEPAPLSIIHETTEPIEEGGESGDDEDSSDRENLPMEEPSSPPMSSAQAFFESLPDAESTGRVLVEQSDTSSGSSLEAPLSASQKKNCKKKDKT